MSLLTAIGVFVVGFLSGTVTRWFAGIAAIVALVLVLLGSVVPDVALVEFVLDEYYLGNELLFISGFLFGIDARATREGVAERPARG